MAEAYLELMDSMKPKGRSQTQYNGDVSSFELKTMRLSADLCRKANKEALDRNVIVDKQPNQQFMVMVDKCEPNSFHVDQLHRDPMPSCPDPSNHIEFHQNRLVHLAVACPTCWALQRNSVTTKKL